jgi:hypothetical protein
MAAAAAAHTNAVDDPMWEKIKFWTRVVVFGALTLYLLIVVLMNWDKRLNGPLQLVFVTFESPRVLVVLLVTAVVSLFGWWLTKAVFKTTRQFRSARDRSRTAKLEKEMADMRAKASMLREKERQVPVATNAPQGFPVVPVSATPVSTTGTGTASVTPTSEDL